jgi:hypothetical protein
VYVEEVVGEVEALGSVGGGGSFFEDGGCPAIPCKINNEELGGTSPCLANFLKFKYRDDFFPVWAVQRQKNENQYHICGGRCPGISIRF